MIFENVRAIVAMAANRVIGKDGDIPWHHPEDFKWFKRTTMGGTLLMGRKTYESIGRPLPGRQTCVISRKLKTIKGVDVLSDYKSFLRNHATDRDLWVAGGSEIYRQLLPHCSEIYLTRLKQEHEGDTFFPAFEDAFAFQNVLFETADFTVERWRANQT